MTLRQAPTVEEYMRPPTREEWEAEYAAGYRGSDGATAVPDTIYGIRIAVDVEGKGVEIGWVYQALPGNRHDYRYRVARRLQATGAGLTEDMLDAMREAADEEFRELLEETVEPRMKTGWRSFRVIRYMIRSRVSKYYNGVREAAGFAFEPNEDEVYA